MDPFLQDLLDLASHRIESREWTQAVEFLNQAIAFFPDQHHPREMLGVVLQFMGEYREAADQLERAGKLGPLSPQSRLSLADCYIRSGRTKQGVRVAERLADDPNVPICVLSRLACFLGKVREFSTALCVCERIVSEAPSAHSAWFGIGFYRARLEFSTRQILPFVREAWRIQSQNTLYSINTGILLIESGETQDGIRLLRSVDPSGVSCRCLVQAALHYLDQSGADTAAWHARLAAISPHAVAGATDRNASQLGTCCVAFQIRSVTRPSKTDSQ